MTYRAGSSSLVVLYLHRVSYPWMSRLLVRAHLGKYVEPHYLENVDAEVESTVRTSHVSKWCEDKLNPAYNKILINVDLSVKRSNCLYTENSKLIHIPLSFTSSSSVQLYLNL